MKVRGTENGVVPAGGWGLEVGGWGGQEGGGTCLKGVRSHPRGEAPALYLDCDGGCVNSHVIKPRRSKHTPTHTQISEYKQKGKFG